MPLRIHTTRGLVLLATVPYDETIVDWIRTLPERHYRPASQDWAVPARREHLLTICGLIGELEERGVDVDITPAASARLARIDIGRAVLREDAVEIAGPFSQRRLPGLRALPERRFDTDRKVWMIPLTRAGALAVLALADDTDELVTTHRVRAALERMAKSTAPQRHNPSDVDPARGPARRSPIPHRRHYTSGPVFENPARERVHVPGIGICVRVRVNPGRDRAG